MKVSHPANLEALRQQPNDELDALAALVLEGAVLGNSAAQTAQAFADGKIVVSRTTGSPPQVQTADNRWSPTRDIAVAMKLENSIRRRGLQDRYVEALKELTGQSQPSSVAATGEGADLFTLINATPRQRTLAAIIAVGFAGSH